MKNRLGWFFLVVAATGPLLGWIFGGNYWFFDLFNHFTFQFLILTLFTFCLLLYWKQYKKIVVLLPVLIFSLYSVYPFFCPAKSLGSVKSSITPLKIFHANVYTANQQYEKLANMINAEDPDLVVLIETSPRWMTELKRFLLDYQIVEGVGREDNFGMAIFSKKPTSSTEIVYLDETQTPSFRIEFQYEMREIILWTAHPFPPASQELWKLRNKELELLKNRIFRESAPTLLVGDLNVTPWSPAFQLVKGSKLTNSAYGFGLGLSWPSFWPKFFRVPIDHILHTKEFVTLNRRVLGEVGSDHFPVVVELAWRE